MKGYRTVLFALFVGALGTLGVHLSPTFAQTWGPTFFAAVTVGMVLLRQFTTTPIFQAELKTVETALPEIPVDQLAQALIAKLPTASLLASFDGLVAAIAKNQPPAIQTVGNAKDETKAAAAVAVAVKSPTLTPAKAEHSATATVDEIALDAETAAAAVSTVLPVAGIAGVAIKALDGVLDQAIDNHPKTT